MKERIKDARGLVIYFSCVACIIGSIFGYSAWSSPGDPVIEGKTAIQVDAVSMNATTGNFSTVSGFQFRGGVATVKVNGLAVASIGDTTISGNSLFNTSVTGASNIARSPDSGQTFYVVSPGGGENLWFFNRDDTAENGTTLYIHVGEAGDTVYSNTPCTPGVSKYVLAGTAMQKKLVIWSDGVSTYNVDTSGSPTVEAN